MSLEMTEAELLKYVVDRARALELLVFHSTDPVRDIGPGFPDLVIAGHNGLILAELKSIRGVWSEDQRAWRKMLSCATYKASRVLSTTWGPADWDSGLIERRLLEIC